MKTCPECSTQYEDHVGTCLVDGTDLSVLAVAPPVAGPPLAAPNPASAPRPASAPAPAPAPASAVARGAPVVGILAVLALGALVAVPVLGGAAWFALRTPPPAPEPVPAPLPPPPPPPAPVEAKPIKIEEPAVVVQKVEVRSEPAGAEVWEGQTRLCVTPCTIDHPEDAPLPRTLTLRLAGRSDLDVSLTDPAVPLTGRWKTSPAPAEPKPKPRNDAAPKIGTQR